MAGLMDAHPDTPAIEVRSLSFAWPGGRPALRDITFAIASAEPVALVGPSGAGKSTLLQHLNGLLPARLPGEQQPAHVAISGQPVRQSALPAIRQRVGFVFQNPDDQLFCPTVREDVAFGPLNLGLPRQVVLQRIADSLAQVGLAGYESRSTLQLSVGERKRVCLAGVLACQPDVLVLDEPFANLDPRSRRGLLDLLRNFPGACLIATHDLDLVLEFCQRVIVLDEGRIRADGDARELLADKALMDQHGLEVPWRLR